MIITEHDGLVDESNGKGSGEPPDEHEPRGRGPHADGELDALAARAAAGDQAAFREVLRRINGLVLKYCRARMYGRAAAGHTPDDTAKGVMLAVVGALRSFRAGGAPFMAFVHEIIRNKVDEALPAAGRDRSDRVDEAPERVDDDDGPEFAALREVDRDRLAHLLGELGERQREILVLRVALGHSAEDTARIIGSTPGAVRVGQHRAMTRLRMLLEQRGADRE